MENASKALIIAGAILISIVLVSVGVIVVNSLDPSSATDTMDQQQVQAFNSKFESYTGNSRPGSTVKQLLTNVMTNNNTNAGDTSKEITVKYDNHDYKTADELTTLKSLLNSATRYNVTPAADPNSGLYTTFTIVRP